MDDFGIRFEDAARRVLADNSRRIIKVMSAPAGWLSHRKGTDVEDTRMIGDCVVEMSGLMVGIRVRRNQFLSKYKNEITIRSKSRGGCQTELQKIKSGIGHLLFYAFATPENMPCDGFQYWRVIDFHKMREIMTESDKSLRETENGDGTAFVPINVGRRAAFGRCSILTSETSPQMNLWEALS